MSEFTIIKFDFKDYFNSVSSAYVFEKYIKVQMTDLSEAELEDLIYTTGFDAKRTGSNTRVSSATRIIDTSRGKEALIKIRVSKPINREHSEAERIASGLLLKYFS